MLHEEASFNKDQFIVIESEEEGKIGNISGSSYVLSENHVEGGERNGRELPYSSSPSLGNGIDIPSPLLLQLSEDLSESVVENTHHVKASNPEPCPASIPISRPPTNKHFPSQVEPVQPEQKFVTADRTDGMNFAYQAQSMIPPNTFNPDNSFQIESEMINNQDNTFVMHDPAATNQLGYTPFEFPSPNWQQESLDSAGRVATPPFNHLGDAQVGAQVGVGSETNGSNFVDRTANWVDMHCNNFGSKEIPFQRGFDGGMNGQGSLYLGGSTPNQFQFSNLPNNPNRNQGGNLVKNNPLQAGQSSTMMGMSMENGIAIAAELEHTGFYDRDGNYITNVQNMRRLMRNTVYDPMYEAMGLPLDPHLRIFLSQRGHDGLESEVGNI